MRASLISRPSAAHCGVIYGVFDKPNVFRGPLDSTARCRHYSFFPDVNPVRIHHVHHELLLRPLSVRTRIVDFAHLIARRVSSIAILFIRSSIYRAY